MYIRSKKEKFNACLLTLIVLNSTKFSFLVADSSHAIIIASKSRLSTPDAFR